MSDGGSGDDRDDGSPGVSEDGSAAEKLRHDDEPGVMEWLRDLKNKRSIADEHDRSLARRIGDEMAKRDVQILETRSETARVERAKQSLFDAPMLGELLEAEAEPLRWALSELILVGGKVLIIAQAKSGKTTLVANLVKALADGGPFLGAIRTGELMDGPVVVVDAEMPLSMTQDMYRSLQITRQDTKVIVLPLRENADKNGMLNILSPAVQDMWVEYLREKRASCWILDPVADVLKACGNLAENEAETWIALQSAVDTICVRAAAPDEETVERILAGEVTEELGLAEADRQPIIRILVHHSGWEGKRGRGSSRQYDWPDTVIEVRRDGGDAGEGANPSVPRYVKAWGRGVDLEETRLWRDDRDRVTLTIDPTSAGYGAERAREEAEARASARAARTDAWTRALLTVLVEEKREPTGTLTTQTAVKTATTVLCRELTSGTVSLSAAEQTETLRRAEAAGLVERLTVTSSGTGKGGRPSFRYVSTTAGERLLGSSMPIVLRSIAGGGSSAGAEDGSEGAVDDAEGGSDDGTSDGGEAV